MYIPANPIFFYIEVGLRGTKLHRHVFVITQGTLSVTKDTRHLQIDIEDSDQPALCVNAIL